MPTDQELLEQIRREVGGSARQPAEKRPSDPDEALREEIRRQVRAATPKQQKAVFRLPVGAPAPPDRPGLLAGLAGGVGIILALLLATTAYRTGSRFMLTALLCLALPPVGAIVGLLVLARGMGAPGNRQGAGRWLACAAAGLVLWLSLATAWYVGKRWQAARDSGPLTQQEFDRLILGLPAR